MPGPTPGSTAELEERWRRWTIGWHTIFVGLAAFCAVAVALDDHLDDIALPALALIGVMVAAYAAVGWRALGVEGSMHGVVYLVVAWSCFLGLIALEVDQAHALLFMLMPQTWAMLRTSRAVAATIVAVGALLVVQVARAGWGREPFLEVLPWALLQLGASLLIGLFITGVFTEAERRAHLIDELERTRSELAEAEHARGILAERQRLAHEIHDTLAQGFTSILALAQAAEGVLERDPALARERLTLLETTARDNLAEARALVGALSPVDLQGASLGEALRRVGERFSRETDVTLDADVHDVPMLAANTEVVLLRAAQEALANVRKHAGATRVRLALRPIEAAGQEPGSEPAVVLTIADDGVGFDLDGSDGFGLHGMRARVEQVGGEVEIVSAPGAGTTVRVNVPAAATS